MSSLVQMQIFYEISMELGVETDLVKTAKRGLSAYLHKLGCLAGVIVRAAPSGDTGLVEQVVTVPRNLANNDAFKAESVRINDTIARDGLKKFLASLPVTKTVGDTTYYLMGLEGFGFLLLIKKGEPFNFAALHGIRRLNQKLGQACLAGLYTDKLEATIRARTEDLRKTNSRLEESLASIKTLKGLLPICASCKKIRDDTGYWNQIEGYLRVHANAEFTHGLCPDCIKRIYPDFADGLDSPPPRAGGAQETAGPSGAPRTVP